MSELKPCPFCGGKAIQVSGEYRDGGYQEYTSHVKCECCGSVSQRITESSTLPAVEEIAAEAWNTRAEQTCHFDQTDKIPTTSGMIRVWECSNCGREYEELNGVYEYCPHCKAKVVENEVTPTPL